MMSNRHHRDVMTLGFHQDGRSADDDLTDAATAEATADHDSLGVAPALQREKAEDHRGELVRELFDGRVKDAGRERRAGTERPIELPLRELITEAGLTQRIF